jgi:hypothetical protein
LESNKPLPFDAVAVKAWERQTELVVYDPAAVSSAGLLVAKGETLGLVVSGLDVDFKVKRSRTYSENTAEFKVYNAKPETRAKLTQPGMRVRFSVGYRDMGGPVGVFWGTIGEGATSVKESTSWVTTIPCISSLTEATGTEDIATWVKKNPNASVADKQAKIASAINRIPVSLSYAPGTRLAVILNDFKGITGLAVYAAETFPNATVPNGFTYVGGVRGAMDSFRKILRVQGLAMHIDNQTIFVYPMDDSGYKVTSAYLTYDSGFLSSTDKTKNPIPPKMVLVNGKPQKIPEPRAYEVKCLLNPKLSPNTLATVSTKNLDTTLLIDWVEFEGGNYQGTSFVCTFEGHVSQGAKAT